MATFNGQNYRKPKIPEIYITFENSTDVTEIETFRVSLEKGLMIYQMFDDSEVNECRIKTRHNVWYQRGTNPDRGYTPETMKKVTFEDKNKK